VQKILHCYILGAELVSIRLQKYSYRFVEQVLSSNLTLNQEIESVLLDPGIDITSLSWPNFNAALDERFVSKGWDRQPPVFSGESDPSAKIDFLKNRVGIEVQFGHILLTCYCKNLTKKCP